MAVNGSIALVSYSEVLRWVGETAASTEYQTVLETFINSVSDYVNNYCKRNLLAADYTEYYDGNDRRTLYLNHFPVNSITGLYIDTESEFGSGTEVAAADYRLHKQLGKVWLENTVFAAYPRSIKVVYNAGYADVDSVPDELKLAVLDDIKWRFKRWELNREGLESVTVEGVNENLVTDVQSLKSSMNVYKRYRRMDHGKADV
jgi:hypothetical protein